MAYLNPASPAGGGLLPQLPQGALSGYLTGAAFGNADQMNQRMMRDDDLEYAINQIRQQADQSNLGVTQAENQNKVSAAGVTADQYASGAQKAAADAALAAATSGSQAKDIGNKDAIRQAIAPDVVNMGEYIKARGGNLDPKDQSDIDKWTQFAGVMKLHGINVPAFPDHGTAVQMQQWAANAAQYAKTNSQAAVNTIPFQQEMAKVGVQAGATTASAGIRAEATTTAADKSAAARIEAARIAAAGGINRVQAQRATGEKWSQMRDMILSKINSRDDKTVHPDEVPMLKYAAEEAEYNNPQYDIAKTMAMGDPDKLAQIKAASDAVADQKLMGLPGYAQAATNAGTSSIKTKSGPKQISNEADYNALPSGATYVDPTGKTRVKK